MEETQREVYTKINLVSTIVYVVYYNINKKLFL